VVELNYRLGLREPDDALVHGNVTMVLTLRQSLRLTVLQCRGSIPAITATGSQDTLGSSGWW
jgi:hypothetical protein